MRVGDIIPSPVKWIRKLDTINVAKSGGYMYEGVHRRSDATLSDGVYLFAHDKDRYSFAWLDTGKVAHLLMDIARATWNKKTFAEDLAKTTGLTQGRRRSGEDSEPEEVEFEVEWDEPESSAKEMTGCHVLRVAKTISLGEFIAMIPADLKESWHVTDEDLHAYLKRKNVLQVHPLDIL